MLKKTRIVLLLIVVFSTNSFALEKEQRSLFNKQNQLGLRLGIWSNLGDTPPTQITNQTPTYQTKIKETNFYFEGYYGYRLAPTIVGEISIGIVNKGTIIIEDQSQKDIGNLLIYPILIQAKFYPLEKLNSSIKPYLTVGGGMYYGRQSVQFTTSYYEPFKNEKSDVDFYYTIGGGFDYIISNNIGFEVNSKYFPIDFSKSLLTISDYSAFTITVGVKYLFDKKKK